MELKSLLVTVMFALIATLNLTHGFTSPASSQLQDSHQQYHIHHYNQHHHHHHRHHHQQQQRDRAQVSVQTTSGQLNGAKQELELANCSIYKFLAVPYAEAPIGLRRFQQPEKLSSEHQRRVLDATRFAKTCPQHKHLAHLITPLLNVDQEHQISEDCLHLNVYVPTSVGQLDHANDNRLMPSQQLPVIVWVPGEGFDFADARQFDGSYLAQQSQSIVVTVQYRVGIFGFLHAPELNITGNMGLHDQLMALDWVRANIRAFGGDPDRVSFMGRFSGSMGISAILTAPNQDLLMRDGKPLFSRAIMLSGVAVHDWAIDPQQHLRVQQVERKALANNLCSQADVAHKRCLGKIHADDLLRISDLGWRIVIDNQLVGSQSPAEAIEQDRLPSQLEGILIGETGNEGVLCLARHLLDSRKNYGQLIENNQLTSQDFNGMIADDLHIYFGHNTTRADPLQILESVFGHSVGTDHAELTSDELRDRYLDACSSFMIKSHNSHLKRSVQTRNQQVGANPSKRPIDVFHYELKYKPNFSMAPDYVRTAAHGDEVPLIFGLLYSQPQAEVNEVDLLMTQKIMSLVGNFVHGNSLQQSVIEGEHEADSVSTIAIDDQTESAPGNELALAPVLLRQNWSSEAQVHPVEFNDNSMLMTPCRRTLVIASYKVQLSCSRSEHDL